MFGSTGFGSTPTTFGSSGNPNSGFSGFGANANTPAFGTTNTNAFGSSGFGAANPNSSFGINTSNSFGGNTTGFGSTGSGLFNNNSSTNNVGFGSPGNTSLGFGSTNNSSTGFGVTNTASQGFGSKPTGLTGFGSSLGTNTQPSTLGSGGFGSTSLSSFGATKPTSLFGSGGSSAGFGSHSTSTSTGTTSVPYSSYKVIGGAADEASFSYVAITAMPQYENKSFEELRLEDYRNAGKLPNLTGSTSNTVNGGFGSSPATSSNALFGGSFNTVNSGGGFSSLLGTGSTFGPTKMNEGSGSLFGSTTPTSKSGSLFGSNLNTTSGNIFGSTGTGANASNTGLFGGGNTAGTNTLFGTPSTFAPSGGLFGGSTGIGSTPNQGFGSFGSSTVSGSASGGGLFGGGTGSGTSSGTNLFGTSTPSNTGLFGTSTNTAGPVSSNIFGGSGSTVSGFFSGNTSAPSGNVLGSSNLGVSSSGLFGGGTSSTVQSGSGLFGSKPTSSEGLFGSSSLNTSTGGGLFGSSGNQNSGLFGNTSTSASNSTGGGLFGNLNSSPSNTGLFAGSNVASGGGQFTGAGSGPGLFGGGSISSPSNGIFGFNSASTQGGGLFGSTNSASSNLFSSNKNTPQSVSSGSIFGPSYNSNTGLSSFTTQGSNPAIVSSILNPVNFLQSGSEMAKHLFLAKRAWEPSSDENIVSTGPSKRYRLNFNGTNAFLSPGSNEPKVENRLLSLSEMKSKTKPTYGMIVSSARKKNKSLPRSPHFHHGQSSSILSIKNEASLELTGPSIFEINKGFLSKRGGMIKPNTPQGVLLNKKFVINKDNRRKNDFSGLESKTPEKSASIPRLEVDDESSEGSVDGFNYGRSPSSTSAGNNSSFTKGQSFTFNRKESSPKRASLNCPVISDNHAKLGYKTRPSLKKLSKMTDEELRNVSDFEIIRENYGSISWLGTTDVTGLNINEQTVEINSDSVEVYKQQEDTPPVGTKLNKAAIIRIHNVVKPLEFAGSNEEFINFLKESYTKDIGGVFIAFTPTDTIGNSFVGTWIFRVEHFTKYGLDRTLFAEYLQQFQSEKFDSIPQESFDENFENVDSSNTVSMGKKSLASQFTLDSCPNLNTETVSCSTSALETSSLINCGDKIKSNHFSHKNSALDILFALAYEMQQTTNVNEEKRCQEAPSSISNFIIQFFRLYEHWAFETFINPGSDVVQENSYRKVVYTYCIWGLLSTLYSGNSNSGLSPIDLHNRQNQIKYKPVHQLKLWFLKTTILLNESSDCCQMVTSILTTLESFVSSSSLEESSEYEIYLNLLLLLAATDTAQGSRDNRKNIDSLLLSELQKLSEDTSKNELSEELSSKRGSVMQMKPSKLRCPWIAYLSACIFSDVSSKLPLKTILSTWKHSLAVIDNEVLLPLAEYNNNGKQNASSADIFMANSLSKAEQDCEFDILFNILNLIVENVSRPMSSVFTPATEQHFGSLNMFAIYQVCKCLSVFGNTLSPAEEDRLVVNAVLESVDSCSWKNRLFVASFISDASTKQSLMKKILIENVHYYKQTKNTTQLLSLLKNMGCLTESFIATAFAEQASENKDIQYLVPMLVASHQWSLWHQTLLADIIPPLLDIGEEQQILDLVHAADCEGFEPSTLGDSWKYGVGMVYAFVCLKENVSHLLENLKMPVNDSSSHHVSVDAQVVLKISEQLNELSSRLELLGSEYGSISAKVVIHVISPRILSKMYVWVLEALEKVQFSVEVFQAAKNGLCNEGTVLPSKLQIAETRIYSVTS